MSPHPDRRESNSNLQELCKNLISLRFLGSKRRLLPKLDFILKENRIQNCTFGDFFAGSTVVSQFAKSAGFTVKATDILRTTYILLRALVQVNHMPRFEGLKGEIIQSNMDLHYNGILDHLEKLLGEEGFIYNNYCPSGRLSQSRAFFSDANGKKIDRIRREIIEWYRKGKISLLEHDFLLASLLIAASKCANTAGSFYAYLKKPDRRMNKPLKLPRLPVIESNLTHYVADKPAEQVVDLFNVEVLYLDPPYNKNQYAGHYHLLETIAWGDRPKLYGRNGIRPYSNKRSAFCYVEKAAKALTYIVTRSNARHIILSYGNEGIISHEEILRILSGIGKVKIYETQINSYQNHHTLSTRTTERMYYVSRSKVSAINYCWSSSGH